MRRLAIFCVVILSAVSATAAETPEPDGSCMWAVSWYHHAKLYDINAATGAATNPRSMNAHHVADIAWDDAAEVLYAVTVNGGTPHSQSLFTVDPDTGNMQLVGPLGVFFLEGAMAVDPTTGKLYAMRRDLLYELDKSTGAATLVGTAPLTGSGNADVSGMAFDRTGQLFVLDNRSNVSATTLYRLDKSDASVQSSVGVAPKLGSVGGYAIHPRTGVHWVIEGDAASPDLHTLNPLSGALAIVGNSGLGGRGASGLVICGSPPPTNCVDPPANLVSWWTYDETGGGVAADIVGNRHGLLQNGMSWTGGKVSGGLYLDGINDYVQLWDPWYHNPGLSDFTLDLWIRTNDTGTVSVIYDKRHFSNWKYYGYEFFLSKGYLALQLATGGYTNYVSGSTGGTAADGFVADGQWHMIAVTVDRDDPQGIRWYIDGVEVGTRRNPTAHNTHLTSTAVPVFGKVALGAGSYLNATIDEFEAFARALTPGEISAIYLAGSHGKCKQ